MKPRKIELLAPARDADTAIAAFRHGADAVYMGASSHGARAAAGNSIDDVARVVEEARKWDGRVYATVNTLIYDNELTRVERLINDLYRIEVDALIVQDMGLLRMDIPPIELHASTQCDIRDAATARFLADAGFARLVLARELSANEISEIHKAVPDVELEAFVHGALCVSYSGDCRASFMATGRSANRGECAQLCRLPYDLVDAHGRLLAEKKHLLSLRDMNRSAHAAQMADAGVCSFKIEGRLKDMAYVKNAVAAYRAVIDNLIDASDGRYIRSSLGRSETTFEPDLRKSFNRGFTSYFLNGPSKMACFDTPKSIGEKVGVTTARSVGKEVKVALTTSLANGDGLGWFDTTGKFNGVRLNKVHPGGNLVFAREVDIPYGTPIYRNSDKVRNDILAGETGRRFHEAEMTLRTPSPDTIAIDMRLRQYGLSVSVATHTELQKTMTPQASQHQRVLSKTGDTIYRILKVNDSVEDIFIPASELTALRRKATEAMDRALRLSHRLRLRLPEGTAVAPSSANVANNCARRFYRDHGIENPQSALETSSPAKKSAGELKVMTTRYCLRREMGACLRTAEAGRLPSPLYLRASEGKLTMRLEFDCERCGMNLFMTTERPGERSQRP